MSGLSFFVSDLHGRVERYRKLLRTVEREKPSILFMGGDLLPSALLAGKKSPDGYRDFIHDFLVVEFTRLKEELGRSYPAIFVILGNDDARFYEASILDAAAQNIWHYVHNRHMKWNNHIIFGYSFIPPSPFRLKDWEKYDVSRYIDPGCIHPSEGIHTIPVSEQELMFSTIQADLDVLAENMTTERCIGLFHAPPYQTTLDRAALDGKMIDYVPLDVHIGSIAIRRWIEKYQPAMTLHGHVHESARLTGTWRDRIGNTRLFSAAHDGPELALIRFDPVHPDSAVRELL